MNRVYPWQLAQWTNWLELLNGGNVPHAVLLHGTAGCGLPDFALEVCRSLLCTRGKDGPCGDCRECRLFASGNHPDYLKIESEKNVVKVGQVREAIDFLHLGRHYDRHRVVLFANADELNHAAANSLLKTLEEPPPWSVIVMVSHHPFQLPPTVRSRCRKIRFPAPGEEAVEWLAGQAGIAPERVRKRLARFGHRPLDAAGESDAPGKEAFQNNLAELLVGKTPLAEMVTNWLEQPPDIIQQWLLESLQAVIRQKFGAPDDGGAPDFQAGRVEAEKLLALYERQVERCRETAWNPNPRLLFESSLLEWRRAFQ